MSLDFAVCNFLLEDAMPFLYGIYESMMNGHACCRYLMNNTCNVKTKVVCFTFLLIVVVLQDLFKLYHSFVSCLKPRENEFIYALPGDLKPCDAAQ